MNYTLALLLVSCRHDRKSHTTCLENSRFPCPWCYAITSCISWPKTTSCRWLGKSSKIIWFSQKNTRRYVAFCETGHVSTLSYLTPGVTCWVFVSVGIVHGIWGPQIWHTTKLIWLHYVMWIKKNTYVVVLYLEPVFVLYFDGLTLQYKANIPIKTRVIWVPGKYTQYIIYYYALCICLYAHIFSTQSSPYGFPPSGHLSWVKLGALSNVAMMPNWMVWSLAVLTGCVFGHV